MKSIIIFLFIMANILFASDELVEIGRYSMPNTRINGAYIWQDFAYLRTKNKIFKLSINNPQALKVLDSITYNSKTIISAGYCDNYAFIGFDSTLVKVDLETMTISDSIKFDYNIGLCHYVINDSFLVVPTETEKGVNIYNIKHSLTTIPICTYNNKNFYPSYAIFRNNIIAYSLSIYYGFANYDNNEFSEKELKKFCDTQTPQIHPLLACTDYYLTNDLTKRGMDSSTYITLKQVYYDTEKGEKNCYLHQLGGYFSTISSIVEYKNRIIAATDSFVCVIANSADNNLEVVSKYPAKNARLASSDKYLYVATNDLKIFTFDNTDRVEEPIEEPIQELIVNNGVIHLNQESNEVIIFDINGVELKHLHNTSNIDVNNLHHGVYFIKIDEKKYKINI